MKNLFLITNLSFLKDACRQFTAGTLTLDNEAYETICYNGSSGAGLYHNSRWPGNNNYYKTVTERWRNPRMEQTTVPSTWMMIT
jgi:hypothetical protein